MACRATPASRTRQRQRPMDLARRRQHVTGRGCDMARQRRRIRIIIKGIGSAWARATTTGVGEVVCGEPAYLGKAAATKSGRRRRLLGLAAAAAAGKSCANPALRCAEEGASCGGGVAGEDSDEVRPTLRCTTTALLPCPRGCASTVKRWTVYCASRVRRGPITCQTPVEKINGRRCAMATLPDPPTPAGLSSRRARGSQGRARHMPFPRHDSLPHVGSAAGGDHRLSCAPVDTTHDHTLPPPHVHAAYLHRFPPTAAAPRSRQSTYGV